MPAHGESGPRVAAASGEGSQAALAGVVRRPRSRSSRRPGRFRRTPPPRSDRRPQRLPPPPRPRLQGARPVGPARSARRADLRAPCSRSSPSQTTSTPSPPPRSRLSLISHPPKVRRERTPSLATRRYRVLRRPGNPFSATSCARAPGDPEVGDCRVVQRQGPASTPAAATPSRQMPDRVPKPPRASAGTSGQIFASISAVPPRQ